MKKIFAFIAFFAVTSQVLAQLQPASFRHASDKKFISPKAFNQHHNARTTQCGPDTVYYSYGKASSLRGLSINTSSSADKVCQWFDAPQQMMIYGFTFFAWQGSGTNDTIPITCSAYIAGSDSLPTGPLIATTAVKVDSVFGNGNLAVLEKTARFSSPVLINYPFVLVIETASPVGISVVCNDWDSTDGGMEWLASAHLPASGWLYGYQVNVGGAVFNADFLFQPIVTYDMDASFQIDTNCILNGGTVTFTNTSNDPILYSKFYNQYVFDHRDSLVYTWFYDDGSPLDFLPDAQHTFAAGRDYEVKLSANLSGWSSICTESQTTVINPQTVSDFTYTNNGLNVTFHNSSAFADSSYWDFGDGTFGTTFNPIHTFPSKTNYDVSLVCFGYCNNDTLSMTINLCDSVLSDFNYILSGNTANFNVTALVGSASFLWSFGDGSNGSGITVNHTYVSGGSYDVCLIVSNDCMSDTTCKSVLIAPTGIEDVFGNNLDVFPNPVKDRLTIQMHHYDIPIKVGLYDHIGKLLKTESSSDSFIQLDTDKFSNGIYIVKIEINGQRMNRKVLISR